MAKETIIGVKEYYDRVMKIKSEEGQKEIIAAKWKAKYKEIKAKGICGKCMKAKARPGKLTCEKCKGKGGKRR